MALSRPTIQDAQGFSRSVLPGDLIAGGESILAGAIAVTAGTVWTGAAIATGIIRRTGPSGAGYTDTTDTAANIIAAIRGNANSPDIVPGTTFRLLVQNTIAQVLTLAAGTGVTLGTGTTTIANSSVRTYLVTVLNAMTPITLPCTLTNNSKVALFGLQANQVALPIGPGSTAGQINVGATLSISSGYAAGTTVTGLTYGQGGLIGFTSSNNYTGTTGSVAVTFLPSIQIDSLQAALL